MFGHQDDHDEHADHHDQQPTETLLPEPSMDGILTGDNNHGVSAPVVSSDQPATDNFSSTQPTDAPQPSSFQPASDAFAAPVATPAPDAPPSPTPDVPASEELLSLKQQALTELTPLVGHLEQSPEEKFRTTMMMIQASDNQELLKTAYQAAQSIPDEKTKAQALLDVVNEINYFTQQHASA